jgi:hypothetical protein
VVAKGIDSNGQRVETNRQGFVRILFEKILKEIQMSLSHQTSVFFFFK